MVSDSKPFAPLGHQRPEERIGASCSERCSGPRKISRRIAEVAPAGARQARLSGAQEEARSVDSAQGAESDTGVAERQGRGRTG